MTKISSASRCLLNLAHKLLTQAEPFGNHQKSLTKRQCYDLGKDDYPLETINPKLKWNKRFALYLLSITGPDKEPMLIRYKVQNKT